jgi:hypothetical protein
MFKASGEYTSVPSHPEPFKNICKCSQKKNIENFQTFDSINTSNNDSWIGYTDKRNYLRGGTFINGGIIGENGDFSKALQINPEGVVTSGGGFNATPNDSWLGWPGDKRNYLRGGTFINGGIIGEGGNFSKALQINPEGVVTSGGGFNATPNDSWLGYPGDKYNYLRGGTVVKGGFIGEGGDMKNALQIDTSGNVVIQGVTLSGADITNIKAKLGL